jgi:ribosomal protein L21
VFVEVEVEEKSAEVVDSLVDVVDFEDVVVVEDSSVVDVAVDLSVVDVSSFAVAVVVGFVVVASVVVAASLSVVSWAMDICAIIRTTRRTNSHVREGWRRALRRPAARRSIAAIV